MDNSMLFITAMELTLGFNVDYNQLRDLSNGDSDSGIVVLKASGKFWKKKAVDETGRGTFVSNTLVTLVWFLGQLIFASSTTII